MWIMKQLHEPKGIFDYGERVDVICDICGNSCMKDQPVRNYQPRTAEHACFQAAWGRRKIDKIGDSWHCDLCGDCSLKIKEAIENLGGKVLIGYHGIGKITDSPYYMQRT